jgi:Fe2+ transport system protein FeoA
MSALETNGQKRRCLVYQTYTMTIAQAPLNQILIVQSFLDKDPMDISDLESRLMHLGFIPGAEIKIKKKAAFFNEPLLVEVRGRSIALSLEEALLVKVKVLS